LFINYGGPIEDTSGYGYYIGQGNLGFKKLRAVLFPIQSTYQGHEEYIWFSQVYSVVLFICFVKKNSIFLPPGCQHLIGVVFLIELNHEVDVKSNFGFHEFIILANLHW
jgi:hypothetical protein